MIGLNSVGHGLEGPNSEKGENLIIMKQNSKNNWDSLTVVKDKDTPFLARDLPSNTSESNRQG
jgi:hypothetical protein